MDFPQQKKLYIYNKKHQRLHPEKVSFYFFGSGSSGNSVYLKTSHLLIDLGFPFKKYHEFSPLFFYDCHYILLTHEHSDHLNVSTMFRILDLYPHIKFLISTRMYKKLISPLYITNFNKNIEKRNIQKDEIKNKYHDKFIIMDADTKEIELYKRREDIPNVKIYPHVVTHGDITNIAYELKTHGLHVLYSSDLDHVFAPKGSDNGQFDNGLNLPLEYDKSGQVKFFDDPFNLIFLEANYDEDILNKILTEEPDNAHARGNLRHISEQETWKYINYALSDDGTFIPLHASSAYGTLVQNVK